MAQQYIRLEIDQVTRVVSAQIGVRIGMRNDGDADALPIPADNRQADAFDRNRPFFYDVGPNAFGHLNFQPPVCLLVPRGDGLQRKEAAHAVDVTLDHVAAEGRARRRGQLKVHLCARSKLAERGPADRFFCQVSLKAVRLTIGSDGERREADAADRDAIARLEACGKARRMDRDVVYAAAALHAEDGAGFLNEAGEHTKKLLASSLQLLPAIKAGPQASTDHESQGS